MGRLPAVRASYSADLAMLGRLLNAVERDNKHGKEWKTRTTAHIRGLIFELTLASAPKIQA